MSLMSSSRYSPLRLIVWAASTSSGLRRSAQQDVGEAEDGGHGRADFVAHVGQEFALGLVAAWAAS